MNLEDGKLYYSNNKEDWKVLINFAEEQGFIRKEDLHFYGWEGYSHTQEPRAIRPYIQYRYKGCGSYTLRYYNSHHEYSHLERVEFTRKPTKFELKFV